MVDVELLVWMTMTVVGFGLLLVSFLGGGDTGDVGDVGDVGGVDHDVSGVESPGLSPVSIPMISTFLATAGGTGVLLNVSGSEPVSTAILAMVVGVVCFLGVFIFIANFLVKAQSSSLAHIQEYEGKTGVVIETIAEGGVGAVAVTVRGTRCVVSARSDGRKLPMGTEVMIKRLSESIAIVEEVKQT